jgi:mannosyltransferase
LPANQTLPRQPLPRTLLVPTWLALGIILLLAAGLRVYHLGTQSLWLDECFSLECSFGHNYAQLSLPRNVPLSPAVAYTNVRDAKPWWMIPRSLDRDLHPPLGYLLLRGWTGMFGYSESALRSLSVLASLGSIILLFAIARQLHGESVARWSALLMALAQYQVSFAQEAKHYALLTTLSLACVWLALLIVERGATAWRCAGLVALSLAAMFTHYYAIETIAVLMIWIAIRTRGAKRVKLLLAMGLAVTIFVLTWGPVVLRQRRNISNVMDFLAESDPHHLIHTLQRAAVIPARLLSEPPPGWDHPAAVGGIIICLLPWLLVRRRPDLLLWGLWLPAVVLPTLLIDLRSGSWALLLIRYTLLAGPAVYCIVAAATSSSKSRLIQISVPLAAALSCLLAIPDVYHAQKTDWRTFGRYLAAHVTPDDLVVFASKDEPIYRPNFYLLCSSYYSGPLPCPILILDRPADPFLLRMLAHYRRVILVTDANTPDELIPGATLAEAKYMPLVGSVLSLTLPTQPTSNPSPILGMTR